MAMPMPMASSLSNCATARVLCTFSNPISLLHSSPVIISFPITSTVASSPHLRRLFALRTAPDGAEVGCQDPDSRKKPVPSPVDEDGLDWENQILEDTVPLVGYVRMILHSKQYEDGDKLSPEHEKAIRERLLPHHPELEQKIGPGIDYITVGHHPDFPRSRCLFIARKDGELHDFSYWKCIKGLIRKKYPLHADRFIQRHFKPRTNKMY